MIGTARSYSGLGISTVAAKPGTAEKVAFASLEIDFAKINRLNMPDLAVFAGVCDCLRIRFTHAIPIHQHGIPGYL